MDMRKQFSTIGITAMYEVMSDFDYIEKDLLGYEYYSQKAIDFAKKIFETIDAVKDSFTDQYSFNIEAIPGETANVVLSKKDRMLFSTPECVMYSNQWIPLTAPCTVHEKIRLGSILDPMCSGGQIAHINLEGQSIRNVIGTCLIELRHLGLNTLLSILKSACVRTITGFW